MLLRADARTRGPGSHGVDTAVKLLHSRIPRVLERTTELAELESPNRAVLASG